MKKQARKCVALLVVFSILLSMMCLSAVAVEADDSAVADNVTVLKYGDVNDDGIVSTRDALEMQKHIASMLVLTGDAFVAGDVNGDGKVTVADVLLVQRYVAKEIDKFPVEEKPTDPPTQPTDPPTKPTDPPTKPTDPPTQPTDPPTKPTDPPTQPTQPTTPPAGGVTVNGEEACVGDQVVYTAKLQADQLVAGINAHIDYTESVLKFSDATIEASKRELFPVLCMGSIVWNFEPIDGTARMYFNAADAIEGFDFTTEDVVVTVTFDVIAKGDATIETNIAQILQMVDDPNEKNPPLEDYTLRDEVEILCNGGPTEPTDPSGNDATVNGQKVAVGDQVTYTVSMQADQLVAGVNAHINYTDSVLKFSDATVEASKRELFPVLCMGSIVWNFEPNDGTARMYFNAADAIEGFDFTTEDVLVTVTFDVIAKGNATVETEFEQILAIIDDPDEKNPPLEDYTVKDEIILI